MFMEDAPAGLDIPIMTAVPLAEIPGVPSSPRPPCLDHHLGIRFPERPLAVRKGTDPRAVLRDANEVLTSRFGIRHSTLQTEECDEPACPTGSCEDSY